MAYDALGAHARDELGITEMQRARPLIAAAASAGTFAVGTDLLLVIVLPASATWIAPSVVVASIASVAILGMLADRCKFCDRVCPRDDLGNHRDGTDVRRRSNFRSNGIAGSVRNSRSMGQLPDLARTVTLTSG